MANYKIDLGKLNEINTSIKDEQTKINEVADAFSSVASSQSDATAMAICSAINQSTTNIKFGYTSLTSWLAEYITAVTDAETKAIEIVNNMEDVKFDLGYFSQISSTVNSSNVSGFAGSLGTLGGISSGTGTGEEVTNPYDELFNKMKELQSTDNLEAEVKNLNDEINTLEKTLSGETNPTEKKVQEDKLDNLRKQLKNTQYELEIMMLSNSLHEELNKFKTFDEYKAYVESIKVERDKLLEKLQAQDKEAAELLNVIINDEDFDKSKPIYYYKDEKGLHYSYGELSNGQKITYEELCQKFNKDDLDEFIKTNEEYQKHQKIVTYIEETVDKK